MVTERELLDAIEECKNAPTTYANCERLATLCSLHRYFYGENETVAKESDPTRATYADINGDSDFLRAVVKSDPRQLWATLDELMDVLSEINPRLYDGVMRRIK